MTKRKDPPADYVPRMCDKCGQPVPYSRHIKSTAGFNEFCSRFCRVQYHNDKARADRLQVWLDSPLKVCPDCGKAFKAPFRQGWMSVDRCQEPGCPSHAKKVSRDKCKAKLARVPRHVSKAEPKYRCQQCHKWITDGNRLHCKECKAGILSREDSWVTDYAVETIDIRGSWFA